MFLLKSFNHKLSKLHPFSQYPATPNEYWDHSYLEVLVDMSIHKYILSDRLMVIALICSTIWVEYQINVTNWIYIYVSVSHTKLYKQFLRLKCQIL